MRPLSHGVSRIFASQYRAGIWGNHYVRQGAIDTPVQANVLGDTVKVFLNYLFHSVLFTCALK